MSKVYTFIYTCLFQSNSTVFSSWVVGILQVFFYAAHFLHDVFAWKKSEWTFQIRLWLLVWVLFCFWSCSLVALPNTVAIKPIANTSTHRSKFSSMEHQKHELSNDHWHPWKRATKLWLHDAGPSHFALVFPPGKTPATNHLAPTNHDFWEYLFLFPVPIRTLMSQPINYHKYLVFEAPICNIQIKYDQESIWIVKIH